MFFGLDELEAQLLGLIASILVLGRFDNYHFTKYYRELVEVEFEVIRRAPFVNCFRR